MTRNNLINFQAQLSYDWKKDIIHIISDDPQFALSDFHISLHKDTATELAARKLLERKGVIRSHDKNAVDLTSLVKSDFLDVETAYRILQIASDPKSKVAVTGGTGSGKTTLLSAIFNSLAKAQVSARYAGFVRETPLLSNISGNPSFYEFGVDDMVELIQEDVTAVFIDELRGEREVNLLSDVVSDKTTFVAYHGSSEFPLERLANVLYSVGKEHEAIVGQFTHVFVTDIRNNSVEIIEL